MCIRDRDYPSQALFFFNPIRFPRHRVPFTNRKPVPSIKQSGIAAAFTRSCATPVSYTHLNADNVLVLNFDVVMNEGEKKFTKW